MDPISNADRLALILRQTLQERTKARRNGRSTQPGKAAATKTAGLRALAEIEGADERQLRRAVIQTLLAEEFGKDLLNDAQFQQVVSRVTEAIEDNPVATKLLTQVIGDLRA